MSSSLGATDNQSGKSSLFAPEEMLFFGTKPVFFRQEEEVVVVGGGEEEEEKRKGKGKPASCVHTFDAASFCELPAESNSEAREAALKRTKPLKDVGEEYSRLIVVAVPRTDVVVVTPNHHQQQQQQQQRQQQQQDDEERFRIHPNQGLEQGLHSLLPAELRAPLVKVPHQSALQSSSSIMGVDNKRPVLVCGLASGVRSGLFKVSDPSSALFGKWIRLKGCGNGTDGFTIRKVLNEEGLPVLFEDHDIDEIRGCCFAHTSAIELFMTHRINSLLQPLGFRTANSPLAWFEYARPADPYPKIQRTCGVFETVGDRRLSDHVLRGLELLLPYIVGSESLTGDLVQSWFPEGAFGSRGSLVDGSFVFDEESDSTHMQFVCGGSDNPLIFADLADTPLPEFHVPSGSALSDSILKNKLPESFLELCAKEVGEFERLLSAAGASRNMLLGRLYWEFGYECGVVSRILSDAQISWGTFRDLSGTHCNAHGNNFALLAPPVLLSDSSSSLPHTKNQWRFLAPLDFDFSYSLDVAVMAGAQSPEENLEIAKECIRTESRALAMDLGLYSHTTGTKNDHEVLPPWAGLRLALRDTMVRGFLNGYEFQTLPNLHPFPQEWVPLAYSLLKLGLLFSADVVA